MVSLSDIKTYLGISSSTYDSFLTEQELIISQSIEAYCGRIFSQTSYIQTFYSDDYPDAMTDLSLFHFPLISVTYVKEKIVSPAYELAITSDVRLHKPTSNLYYSSGYFNSGELVEVSYSAGYATIPAPIRSVILSLIEEKYNKKINGVSLNFGSDVQSISIPGTISVAFDYSLQANERKTSFGTILGNYVNVLDFYRSERRIVGSGKISYVA